VRETVDLLVVGGGTAGIVAAKTAGRLGADVVLAERDRTGGDCLWTGCVPSKALLAAAATARRMRTADRFGIAAVRPEVDFTAVRDHVRRAIETIEPVDSPEALRAAGARVRIGAAVFTGEREATIAGVPVRFRHAVIATGSEPALPEIPGLAGVDPLTSDSVWQLSELPRSMVVLGGGPVGCELGQAFARLGTEVTIVEAARHLLPREEPAAGAALAEELTGEGIQVCTGVSALRAGQGTLEVAGPAGARTLHAERVLVATGRRPRSGGIGLEAAGVRCDAAGRVVVDGRLRTSNPRIYAAGDVTGLLPFTHVAGTHGSVAATNAVLAPLRRVDHETMPWVTFTDPEVAHVGLTEAAARSRHGASVRVRTLPHGEVDRAVTDARTDGFTLVVLDRRGRILGATIVAPRAGEMLAELTAALHRRATLRELAGAVHPYPTWGDGVWNAALAELAERLGAPALRRGTDLLRALRRAAS
jgi:pyruvate/2-oxoglutarate dehydrogenase complex dihydrolipoamide dehydrogenase (E3) component